MSSTVGAYKAGGPPASADQMAVLFSQLVIQQSNMAIMLLGKTPNPETGKPVQDLEAAKFFIDQLEMLEIKTRGNLSKEEEALLKQSLMSLRLAFVEAVDETSKPSSKTGQSAATEAAARPAEPAHPSAPLVSPETTDEPGRKKFSKTY